MATVAKLPNGTQVVCRDAKTPLETEIVASVAKILNGTEIVARVVKTPRELK